MAITFQKSLQQLKTLAYQFGPGAENQKTELLNAIKKLQWKKPAELETYQDLLLFMAAHPESESLEKKVEAERERIAAYFKKKHNREDDAYRDSGFPFTTMQTQFSHDLLRWLRTDTGMRIGIDSFDETGESLNTLLNLTLPASERDETTAGLSNTELLDALGLKEKDRFAFLLNEFSRFDRQALLKDHLWHSMKLWVDIRSDDKHFSKLFNRLPAHQRFYSDSLLKKFDAAELLARPLSAAVHLDGHARASLESVIKRSLTLTMRETDPATYMDPNTLRLFQLERGIQVALYGMVPERQLPLQSYIGYTLFRNGYPAAYGGSWVAGTQARFGLNIFESFRGGESGYIMCQLLRVYRQVFSLERIEVEAYQFGRDNPDGIRSGAFWFYYRYGFRPIEPALAKLAEKEAGKIRNTTGYRSSEATLIRFTESDMRLAFSPSSQVSLTEITASVCMYIRKDHKGDRLKAEREAMARMGDTSSLSEAERCALPEFALLASAFNLSDAEIQNEVRPLIHLKTTDPYRFNSAYSKFLSALKR